MYLRSCTARDCKGRQMDAPATARGPPAAPADSWLKGGTGWDRPRCHAAAVKCARALESRVWPDSRGCPPRRCPSARAGCQPTANSG